MLVHPEQGAKVPAKGPMLNAMGFSGEDDAREGSTLSRKKFPFKPLPPMYLSRSPSGISSVQAL
jgi:hypothetical protein